MKKVSLVLGVAFLMAIGLSSCKKSYTCECTISGTNPAVKTTYTTTDTKKNAESWCNAYNTSGFGAVICTLK
jgi:hypothetical protein